MSSHTIDCPSCGYKVELCLNWVAKNERAFCGTCCKAFDVKLASQNHSLDITNKDAFHEVDDGSPF